MTGQSLYEPRVMMRTLAQVLTGEYSEHGVHVASAVIDGLIDSPGTRALAQQHPEVVMNPRSPPGRASDGQAGATPAPARYTPPPE